MDWKKLLGRLAAAGLTQPQIAKLAGCGQATVSDLSNGTTCDPRTSTAFALLKLAYDRGIALELPWGVAMPPSPSKGVTDEGLEQEIVCLGRRTYPRDALASGIAPDVGGRRRDGPGRRETDRMGVNHSPGLGLAAQADAGEQLPISDERGAA